MAKIDNKIGSLQEKLFALRGNLNHSINSCIVLGAFDKHTSLMYFHHDSDKIYVRHSKKGKETWLVINNQA